ncbi:hypothetical protein ACHAXS_003567 [Conticribra weissflogii]
MKSATTVATLSIIATASAAPEVINAPQRMRSSANKIASQPQREQQASNGEEPYDTFLGLRELQESMSMSMASTEGSMPTEEIATVGPDGTPSTEETDDETLGVDAKSASAASSAVVSGAISAAVLFGAYALF